MITVGDAIEEARDEHPAFTERNVPDSVIRRKLNRYQRELYARVIDADKQWVATTETQDLDTYDFDTGFTPSGDLLKPLGGDVHFTNDDRTVRLRWVPYKNRKSPGVPYPAYYLNGVIYLCGIEDDWHGVEKVDFVIITEPTDLTQNSDTFDLPDGAEHPLVKFAALEMAKRGPVDGNGNQPSVEAFLTLFERAEQTFITEIRERDRAEESYVREEW